MKIERKTLKIINLDYFKLSNKKIIGIYFILELFETKENFFICNLN
jgi:hypothetical protein